MTEVQAVVEQMIAREVGDDRERADTLLKGLYGALDGLKDMEGFSELAIGVLADQICSALGFTPDWDD